MNSTQKKVVEIPLLFALWWTLQAAQVALLQLPFNYGSVDVTGVLLAYFALTRGWGRLAAVALVFSYLGSFTVGYSATVFVAVQLWTAFVAKLLVSEFTMEGRRLFLFLAAGAQLFARVLTWGVLRSLGAEIPVRHLLGALPFCVVASGVCAWILYPLFVRWDEYFQHPIDEARELNPDVLR